MAQIIKKPEPPQKKGPSVSVGQLISGVLLLLVAVILAIAFHPFLAIIPGIIGVILFLSAFITGGMQNTAIRRVGEVGEDATAHLISQLPQGYYGFRNVYVTYDGKQSEIDMVVVGKTGVFIIETKHLNGYVVGNYESHDWILHKIGRRGGSYSKEFYSPVKQVGTHVYRLANFMRSQGVNVRVEAMVFFTNPNTNVTVSGVPGRIPVYTGQPGATSLVHNIMGGQANLTPQQIASVCNLLNRCL